MPDMPSKHSSAHFLLLGSAMRTSLRTSREQSFRISGRIRFRMTPKETIRERANILSQITFNWLGRQDSNLGMAESKSVKSLRHDLTQTDRSQKIQMFP